MKKKYEKPGLFVENFALSQAVARNCGFIRGQDTSLGKPGFRDNQTCGWDMTGYILWDGGKNCTIEPPNDEIDAGCYNNPSDLKALFAYS